MTVMPIWTTTLRVIWGIMALLPAVSSGIPDRMAATGPEPPFPLNYFQLPVDPATARLSGTFGELRPDHFHAGIDISSTRGSIGQPIYAAADGFIDRIRIQESGYGNVLYVKHPNGYTTVYAHLDKFMAPVERYVREAQYKRERFEVDLSPPDGAFKVKKGEIIAKMGNSGSSEGPHLHFEIRRSATQKALNPLLFDLPIPDQVPPELRDMKVYVLNEQREVLSSLALPIEQRQDGKYGVRGDTVRLPGWRVGFGLKTFDRATGNPHNQNGIYALTLMTDDRPVFQWHMAELDFDESRYLNAHADYSAHERYGAWFHRCFVLPGDRMSNYGRTESLGAVTLYKDQPVKITVMASDSYNNLSTVTFWALREDPVPAPAGQPFQFELPYEVENRIDMDDFSLVLPKGALYETLYFQYSALPEAPSGAYSPLHRVHNNTEPLHRYCNIAILPQSLPENLRPKAIIARTSGNGRPVNCGGTWRNERLETRVREFGDYCVMVDTTPPSITPIGFNADMRRKHILAFRLRDNFRIDGTADNLRYRGTIDGKWVLFEFDRKRARLSHTFDARTGPGEHTLRLVVTDDRGNETVLERKFNR